MAKPPQEHQTPAFGPPLLGVCLRPRRRHGALRFRGVRILGILTEGFGFRFQELRGVEEFGVWWVGLRSLGCGAFGWRI